ncbi:hypothetical protein PAF17_02545 [Paracoccus sp. Z330]|uniref:4'-phosphopantetheinyl transferase N-terminal domain-containing protein n=1 Tax=Paracoccus onchidii TaxID=3017813 RepID=A0ABT4ZAJ7_9RHOB|nr:hypothetical protein [Paracoccus onchidii]MDB6176379.1 hypothetical protein [Paracoccus onchidii]
MRAVKINTRIPFAIAGIVWAELDYAQLRDVAQDSFLVSETIQPVRRICVPSQLSRAGFRRRRDWMSGRLCAMRALEQIGRSADTNATKLPIHWPAGVAGSISHDRLGAVAAVSTRFRRIGVDRQCVFDNDEATLLAPIIQAPGDDGFRPDCISREKFLTILFCAKEAAYKAMPMNMQHGQTMDRYSLRAFTPDYLQLLGPRGSFFLWWHINETGATSLAIET